jgi:eukaryotic-like serine/threonine-protein kinase
MIGSTIRHYAIDGRLGEGGMGTVYRARDTLLKRTVAIKVLASSDPESARRLLHEARAASALNHPNIVTIYAVEQQDETAFIVMEHVDGESLDRAIPPEGLAVDRVLDYSRDIADALTEAHAHGIVHRDVKPANVMIARSGRAKVLDFGIARQTPLPDARTRTVTIVDAGLAGTPGYLAPEQLTGAAAGPRSDLFGLGAVMYHMLAGRPPFEGDTAWSVMDATVRVTPAALATRRPDVPAALERIVATCLDKDPARRFGSAAEVSQALETLRRERAGLAAPQRSGLSRSIVAAALALALVATGVLVWLRVRESRARWARETAMPEITRLTETGEFMAAYRLAQRALANAPNDQPLRAAIDSFLLPGDITSSPPGADVAVRAYSGQDEGWIEIGKTPVTARLPMTLMRWRFTKEGYEPLEIAPNPRPTDVRMLPAGTSPADMVYVPAGPFELESRRTSVALGEYWIDKFEVTNRQFKTFVDAGGYRDRKYWTEPFRKDGRVLSWEDGIAQFRDATNRPGPSTWELGTYKDGEADLPASGVSWYEAAAYASFAGKSLPTVYHWYSASGAFRVFSEILSFSNFGGRGATRVGSTGGLGPYGTYDMAGNVKEWTWNESSEGHRFVLGGAWNEPTYQFRDEDARKPFERGPGFGFRCVRVPVPPDAALMASIATLEPDPALLKPASDEVYQTYRRLYDYDPVPLDAKIDERDESPPHWIAERVSFRAAYGTERVPVVLFLPRSAKPPYQVVIHFPGSNAPRMQSSRSLVLQWVEFLIRDGRAVAYPIYQQTYERRRPVPPGGAASNQAFLREISLQRGLDVRRTVDYLASRSDIDASRIAMYGLSLGAQLAPVYLATEPRLRTGVLLAGGFETWIMPPEADPVHFAPRVRQPVLMVNGEDDFDLPYRTAQLPLFKALGTPEADKKLTVLKGGHMPPEPQLVFKEILDWLDKYLGPVAR